MEQFSSITSAIEPLLLIIALIGTATLAIIIFRNNYRSATNIIFLGLSIFMMLWLSTAYFSGSSFSKEKVIIFHRLAIFFAAPTSALLFLLAHTLPSSYLLLKKRMLWFVFFITIIMMAINISPYAFTGLSADAGTPIPGPGLAFFGTVSTVFSILAIFYLIRKSLRATDKIERLQLRTVLSGMLIMLALVIGTILIPIAIFNSAVFVPFIPVYVLIFLGMTAYAITKYQLFNIKVLVTQALTFVIWIVLFAKIFGEESFNAQIIDGLVLIFTIIFGFFLVRSVRREVEQREYIELLAKDLSKANARLRELDRQKSEFVSIASHQLRSPLTAIRGYASLVLEGSYGKLPEGALEAVRRIADSSQQMVFAVEDFLNVSRIEQGRMKYEMNLFDLRASVQAVVNELLPVAQKKGLILTYTADAHEKFNIKGDEGKLRQVIANIVDNCIKYTPKGSIHASLTKKGNKLLVIVSDTGVGMKKETIDILFNKYVRAENASRVNVGGTGLGLFVAKQFVDAHNGRIWAESSGEGKGSSFFIELNAA